jgi:hypothetical protein
MSNRELLIIMASVHWYDNRSTTIILSENAELKKEIDKLKKENTRLSDLLPKSKKELMEKIEKMNNHLDEIYWECGGDPAPDFNNY